MLSAEEGSTETPVSAADGGHLGGAGRRGDGGPRAGHPQDASIHSMHVTEKAEMAFCVCGRPPLPPSLVITDTVQQAGPHLTATRQDEDPQLMDK